MKQDLIAAEQYHQRSECKTVEREEGTVMRQRMSAWLLALLVMAAVVVSGCSPTGAQTGSVSPQPGTQVPSQTVSPAPSETATATFVSYPASQANPGELAFISMGGATFVAHSGDFRELKGGEAVVVERAGATSAWTIVKVGK